MRSTSFLVLFACGFSNTFSQQITEAWARGSVGNKDEFVQTIACDAIGNVYIAGSFNSDTLLFGSITLTNNGSQNIFLVGYSPGGEVLWAKSFGGSESDFCKSITADIFGNIYATGSFRSTTISFDSITITKVKDFTSAMYVVKMDSNGKVLWVTSTEGSNHNTSGNSITTDVLGNVIVTGDFWSDSITFGTTTLTNNEFAGDMYVVKFDSNGTVIWAKSAYGNKNDIGNSITTDDGGNILVAGHFSSDSIVFNSTMVSNKGYTDVFIVKYAPNGNVLWAKGVGGKYYDYANDIATDAIGNAYITGTFDSDTMFIDTLTLRLGSSGGFDNDMYVVKYNAEGNPLWANKSIMSKSEAIGNGVATDNSGSVYVTGGFLGTITFGSSVFTAKNEYDMFVVQYNPTGNVLWAQRIGNSMHDVGKRIVIDNFKNIYALGEFKSSYISFGADTLINSGNYGTRNVVLAKFSPLASNINGNIPSLSIYNCPSVAIFPSIISSFGTVIYEISKSSNLDLSFHNSSGQIVEKYTYDQHRVGKMKVNLSFLKYAAGTYYVRLETNKFSQTKMFIVVK